MSWTLNGVTIPAPNSKTIVYNTQKVTNRVVSGAISRSYIGSEKIFIRCKWDFISASDFAYIKGQYDDQRAHSNHTKTLVVDELSFNQKVIIDLLEYDLPLPNNYSYGQLTVDFIQR